jgi:peptidoglycan/xylan/chitin deacetylase (PgdA/CDA1 family)
LGYLTKAFSIIALDAVSEPTPKPKMILSFDDGYKDFVEVAAPILRKHRIRANQNVVPACIESGLPPLNVIAQDFVGKAPGELVRKLDVPEFNVEIGPTLPRRLSTFIKTKPQHEQRLLAAHLLPQFFNYAEFQPTPVMTRSDVQQVAAEHDIGAHSYDHATMVSESADYLAADLARCSDYFGEHLGLPMSIYAFPNGSCTRGQVDEVRGARIRHVLLVGERFSTDACVHNRFTFHAASMREALFRAHGGLADIPR